MKNIIKYSFVFSLILLMSSCFENPKLVYSGLTVVEFDRAVTTAPAAGRTYPLLPTINGAGILKARINLVGGQRTSAENIKVSIVTDASTAVSGTHFKLLTETVSIPANSSFGELQIEILRVPAAAGQTRNIVLSLDGNGSDISGSANFKTLGWAIGL